MIKPDYDNAGIVNLMSSILYGLGRHSNHHPPLQALDNTRFSRARNIVLVVIDGLGYNYLRANAPHSFLYRHHHGVLSTVFPSTTATAITTFMTGLAPQQHGLTGWFTYFQELDSIMTVLPAKPRFIRTPPAEPHIDVAASYGHVPLYDLLDVNSHIVTPRHIAYSDYSLTHSGRARIMPYNNLSECFTVTRDIIKSGPDRKYIYTYWPQFDAMAHEKGVKSQDVAEHFRDIDQACNTFIADITGTNTLVLVTADHGIIDSGPDYCLELEHHPELRNMLALPLSGERRMAYCYVKEERRDAFTAFLAQHLAGQITVHSSQALLARHYFGLGDAHPQLRHRIGDYVLEMNENYTIMDTLPGEKHFYHIGTHGGLSEDEMLVPFLEP